MMRRRLLRSRLVRVVAPWGLVGALIFSVGVVMSVRAQLPAIYSLSDYEPIEASELFCEGGELLGLWAQERRTAVPFGALPPHVVHAFLAAEDADFYHHEGIDWWGVTRALIKNMRPGAHLQGASTITQQTVKTLVLGPERSLWRKLREAVLARRLEQLLGKDEILTLYLNQIYFGSGAWGIEQAARTYFGHSVRDCDLFEAALLAAIPKNPGRYTLAADRRAARERQAWVLGQMQLHQWASAMDVAEAKSRALPPMAPPPFGLSAAPHFVEAVRRELSSQYGDQLLLTGGLKIYTPLRLAAQQAATVALGQGAEDIAKRQGFARASAQIPVDELTRALILWRQAFVEQQREAVARSPANKVPLALTLSTQAHRAPASLAAAHAQLSVSPCLSYTRLRVPVVQLDEGRHVALVELGERRGILRVRDMAWTQAHLRDPSEVLHVGDIVTVEVLPQASASGAKEADNGGDATRPVYVALVAEPKFQGALVAIDPRSRGVRAMVGGLTDDGRGFNHATQARRPLGSALKPLLYAAALEQQLITPATLCNDAPVVVPDPTTGRTWKPENYEDGRYDGPITYRQALSRSKNTCSVRLLQRMGMAPLTELLLALGLKLPETQNLTMALGTNAATPLELTRAYTTLINLGEDAPPRLIERVIDRHGRVLAPYDEPPAAPRRVLSAAAAYVTTTMMESVITAGSGHRAQMLKRPLAGKTGTSQQSRDVWFAGYAPQLVASVWLGHDDFSPLGRETGASAALPVWIRLMGTYLADLPPEPFVEPPGLVHLKIDARTGLVSDSPQAIDEVFVRGTEPHSGRAPPTSIYLED